MHESISAAALTIDETATITAADSVFALGYLPVGVDSNVIKSSQSCWWNCRSIFVSYSGLQEILAVHSIPWLLKQCRDSGMDRSGAAVRQWYIFVVRYGQRVYQFGGRHRKCDF